MEIKNYNSSSFGIDPNAPMDIESLEMAIDLKRKEMYASAEGQELYSPDVVRVSQELDILINLYNRFS
ncbi:hypothetical protein ABE82_26695 (plasmid) [Paenibacillus peoriae]|uniref:aspartyl-phosphate phosphatase Spo0E family protein n=1 Tax=Paenibacillus peoriae TaxID=59893 RepID=UPI000720D850|nr:aspartyl-phosphate phosphatase Spo0E family protein [Paenibacillus peoriae]ALS10001.1 hypothetical protein ABE82_26695 [Paenibacillus peoriae]